MEWRLRPSLAQSPRLLCVAWVASRTGHLCGLKSSLFDWYILVTSGILDKVYSNLNSFPTSDSPSQSLAGFLGARWAATCHSIRPHTVCLPGGPRCVVELKRRQNHLSFLLQIPLANDRWHLEQLMSEKKTVCIRFEKSYLKLQVWCYTGQRGKKKIKLHSWEFAKDNLFPR